VFAFYKNYKNGADSNNASFMPIKSVLIIASQKNTPIMLFFMA